MVATCMILFIGMDILLSEVEWVSRCCVMHWERTLACIVIVIYCYSAERMFFILIVHLASEYSVTTRIRECHKRP